MEDRIIGRLRGPKTGPLLIAIGGVHGNELAGVSAIEKVFQLLFLEKQAHPGFAYQGTFLGVRGNLQALMQSKRFIDRDLNRIMTSDEIEQIRNQPEESRLQEEKECLQLIDLITSEIDKVSPGLTLILDLHTTTASGGVFSIAADDEMSLRLAKGLHVPVILGIAEGLKGTTIDYFNQPKKNTFCVVFEAGQHEDPLSVERTVSAIINCMRSIAAVDPIHVDHHHDELLIRLAQGLPRVTRLSYHYKIQPGENFIMKTGFQNFDHIHKGQALAENKDGIITSPQDGFILMPKYQTLGDDGFFIVQEEQ
jgi:succinylglutamate desuccinylase